ncbi:MAG: flavin-containing monooxygenase, partial [Sphingopyxis sp.]
MHGIIHDAIVVGAGFGGVHMLHELQKRGLSAIGIEGGSDVGGAWYWNVYPGARCDVESLLYSYSICPDLDAKWRWSERYPAQAEIQRYIGFAVDLWDVRQLIRFDSWVRSATYDEAATCWRVEIEGGDTLSCRYLVMAPGPLTKVVWPDIEGIGEFLGETYHTARWPEGVALDGKRIGVVGNG